MTEEKQQTAQAKVAETKAEDPRKQEKKPQDAEKKGNVGQKIKAVGGMVARLGAKPTVPARAKLLFSVVNRRDESRLKEVLDECSVALSYAFAGTGTARSAVLDFLGIGETEKAVLISIIPESDELAILRELRKKMSLYLVGRGISFTIPLTGISQIVARGIVSAATNKTTEEKNIMKGADRKYDLIVAAVAANFVDQAMEAARSAGAAGGTIIRARTMDNAKAEQFIGISLVAEQEILLILTKKEGTLAIMNAISEQVGVKTEAGGVIFSLPVDRTSGVGTDEGEKPTGGETRGEAQ